MMDRSFEGFFHAPKGEIRSVLDVLHKKLYLV